ncbi:ABC transporter permease [Streptococcus macedonicus]|uniref:ABC transporter permease n=1 Tax=Streptococcus macedonicus TaxID=59310 RepID=A0AA47ILG4_STRMC|nr:ABC transporter permease [Streptococcus macedonicus]MCW8485380.1 ABC transporter permease [Streptococcus macedonicus]MCW8493601.1 ABC transporter permease [Streptococcus macedonicus]MCW8498854.1 ABC transporter permease [Streptococcus macedonicus]MCW8501036.1 ABC transporter permease [Streptococcus macedonicus]MCW8502898.1 ABC transporter permease [Streptococcus macedonicus]
MKILAISKKVFLELLRDKRTLILLFIAPVFIMWLMNAAFSANTETNVSIAAVDVSDSIVKSLDDVKQIKAKDYKTESKANQALENQTVDAVLIFKDENDYQVTYANTDPGKTNLTRQVITSTLKQAQIQDLIENLKKAQEASAQAVKKAQSQSGNLQASDSNEVNIDQAETEEIYSSQGDDINLSEQYIYGDEDTTFFTKMTPILMGFFVFFFVFLISGMAFLKERTTGTLDRLLATPVKRSDIVYGYMLAYGFIAALQTVVIVLSTIWLLDLEVLGNIGDVIIVNILFALVALAFGLLLSTLAKSEFQMMQFIPLIITPQLFFSGIIPLDSMTGWVQSIGKVLPLYYAGDALSKIVLNGTSIVYLGNDLLVLSLFLVILTILNIVGLKRYRKV